MKLKILAYKNGVEVVIALKGFEWEDDDKIYTDNIEAFTLVEVSFPNGEHSVSELEQEVIKREKEGTIHGLAPHSPSIVDTMAIISLGVLNDLGFEFKIPKEFIDEISSNSGEIY